MDILHQDHLPELQSLSVTWIEVSEWAGIPFVLYAMKVKYFLGGGEAYESGRLDCTF